MTNARHYLVAVLLVLALIVPTATLAGTTGTLTGTVVDASTNTPVPGARVQAVSPSQTATVLTDARGNFTLLSLAPDTYTISVDKTGYDPTSTSGVSVFADQTANLALRVSKTLRVIGRVASRANTDLVRPGTVVDTYSVNAAEQEKVTSLGGGGALNQAYSALASVPGVYVPPGQNGWSNAAGVVIRGGTHSQVGYELDGVPTNVGFNFFPANGLSTLGQQELQVYTGSAPVNSSSQGLSGFVNQVIKTGTYPGFGNASLGIGAPAFFHHASAEAGGASPNRNFSYYIGFLGDNQSYRMIDQNNGSSFTYPYGIAIGTLPCPATPNASFAGCYNATTPGGLGVGPGGFIYAPPNYGQAAYNQDRETVVNLHFGIPHKGDSGLRDDVQLLYNVGYIQTYYYTSQNDIGSAFAQTGTYNFPFGYVYNGALNTLSPTIAPGGVSKYLFPYQDSGVPGAQVPLDRRDQQQVTSSILKLQYQKNLSPSAYLRVYGYGLYANRALNGVGAISPAGIGEPPDYQVYSHTYGYAAEYATQLNPKNLLQGRYSFTRSSSARVNSSTFANGSRNLLAVAVDSTNPNSGLCYKVSASGTATPAACANGQATTVTFGQAYGLTSAAPIASLAGQTCGNGPCTYDVVENGYRGTNNTVPLNTTTFSIGDSWKPTNRLTVDLGVKYNQYKYSGADTTIGAKNFWFAAYNQDYCVNALPGNSPVSKVSLKIPVTSPCSAASTSAVTYVSPNMVNAPANYNFNEWEPRIGATFAVNPLNVVRASYGKYTQPVATSFEQYDTIQQNLPAYIASRFYRLGYNTPGHNIPPQESYNLDASWEHQVKGTDISWKLSPFYRTTRNELTEFFVDPLTQVTSGLAVGSLKTSGVEFQLRKGRFDQNGLSGILSYTYTTAAIKYSTLPTGGTILTPINNDIKTYNAYTSFCATNPGDARCGTTSAGGRGAPCFTAAGNPDAACAAGSIANPYWNAPVQNLLDPYGSYWPTDPVVATTGLGVNGYTVPHVATLIVNYRRNKFAVTPSLQFSYGQRYGSPEANAGIDPAGGCKPLAGAGLTGDPRYPYGAPGGAPYDALTCASALNAIPNVYTGTFDPIAAFKSPAQILGGMTLSYDMSSKVRASLTLANIINQCVGGSRQAWTGVGTPHVCSYESGEISRAYAPTGNAYNPGASFEPFAQYPYFPYFGAYTMGVVNPQAPFSAYLTLSVKL